MKEQRRGGLPIELRRDVNRAAYAQAQASFRDYRARLVADAVGMLRQGLTLAEVRAAMQAQERDAA